MEAAITSFTQSALNEACSMAGLCVVAPLYSAPRSQLTGHVVKEEVILERGVVTQKVSGRVFSRSLKLSKRSYTKSSNKVQLHEVCV